MKSKFLTFSFLRATLAVVALTLASCNQQDANLPAVKSSNFEFKKSFQETVLDNGLTILFEQDKEIPITNGKLFVRGGSLWDGDDEIGLTEAVGSMMRSGGAGSRNAAELDQYLTTLSASVDSSWGDEYGVVTFGGLSSDIKEIFPVFADVVLSPRFEEDRLKLWKSAAFDSIKRRIDDPETIAAIAFDRLLYGKSVYGRTLVSSDVQKITRDNLIKKHKVLLNLSDALLVVSGDVEFDEVIALVKRYFGSTRSPKRVEAPPPPILQPPTPGLYFIKGPFTQSTVDIGQLGTKRNPPDRAQIEVFNEIFGSRGFGTRLMTRIRTQRGLVYGVYGAITSGLVQGTTSINLQTKSASVAEAIAESIHTVEEMQGVVPNLDEITTVQKALRNSFVFKFDSPGQRVEREAILRIMHYPEDYDQKYLPALSGVKDSEIQEVAKKYWEPSKFVVVAVGDQAALDSLKEAVAKGPLSQYFKGVKELTFNEIPSGT